MVVRSTVVGPVQTNCYLLGDERTKQAALIDPGANGRALVRWAEREGYTISMILLTHGHFDHIGGVQEVLDALQETIPVYVHKADYPLARCGFYDDATLAGVKDIRFYGEGDTVDLCGHTIQVLHTPGHTKGGVCLLVEGMMFSGDTLFAGSCGRTDFPGSSPQEMLSSLARLAKLEGDWQVYPGHEGMSTLSRERHSNPFMRQAGQKN